MAETTLTIEELLGGAALTQKVVVPWEILNPAGDKPGSEKKEGRIVLKPLTVKDIQLISRAARDDESLVSCLMVQQSLVSPKLTQRQIQGMSGGLMTFIVDRINQISGLKTDRNTLRDGIQSPLVKACVILSKEFGWTPSEISDMTMGQIILYLETLNTERNETILP